MSYANFTSLILKERVLQGAKHGRVAREGSTVTWKVGWASVPRGCLGHWTHSHRLRAVWAGGTEKRSGVQVRGRGAHAEGAVYQRGFCSPSPFVVPQRQRPLRQKDSFLWASGEHGSRGQWSALACSQTWTPTCVLQ